MSDIDQDQNPARPPRSRFNFSNSRFVSPAPEPEFTPAPVSNSGDSVNTERRERTRRVRLRHKQKSGPLIFNVAQLLLDVEGATRQYDYAQEHLHLNDPVGEDIAGTEATDIKGHIRLMRVRHDVLAQGPGEAEVILNCVRCLKDYLQHIDYEVEEVFTPSIDVVTGMPVEDDDIGDGQADLKIDANHLIDLGEAIRQQILVDIPMQPLCGDDCPGLYEFLAEVNQDWEEPEADNQNEEDDAAEEPTDLTADPRWAALTKLKLE